MIKVIITSLVTFLLAGCGGSSGGYSDVENEEGGYVGNPYSDGTGHFAGYADHSGEIRTIAHQKVSLLIIFNVLWST